MKKLKSFNLLKTALIIFWLSYHMAEYFFENYFDDFKFLLRIFLKSLKSNFSMFMHRTQPVASDSIQKKE